MFGRKPKKTEGEAVVCVQDFQTGKQIYCKAANESVALGLFLTVKKELDKTEKPHNSLST